MLFPISLNATASIWLHYHEKFEREAFCLFRVFVSGLGICFFFLETKEHSRKAPRMKCNRATVKII